MEAKFGPEYYEAVEKLSDLIADKADQEYREQLKKANMKADLSNPYFDKLPPETKNNYARMLFRAVHALANRVGFGKPKRVEGILDEDVIDAIIEEST